MLIDEIVRVSPHVAQGNAEFTVEQQRYLAEALEGYLLYGADVGIELGLRTLGTSPRQRILMAERDRCLLVAFGLLQSQASGTSVWSLLDELQAVVRRRERSKRPPVTQVEWAADDLLAASAALGRDAPGKRTMLEIVKAA